MMELRSRSRSKTPFLQNSETHDDSDTPPPPQHTIITRSRKSINTSINASEHYITSSSSSSTMSGKKTKKQYTTSDYSSEDGESDSRHITENQRNQIIEDVKAAANGTTKLSALDLYRKAGRYWDKYPKTDWTYSPHSKDRIEIAPGVVQMPNMSRPTIHSYYDTSTNTDLTFHQYQNRQQAPNWWLIRYFNYIKYLFSSSSTTTTTTVTSSIATTATSTTKHDESDFIRRKSTTNKSVFDYITTIFITIFSIFYLIYSLQNSMIVWFGKKIHHFTSRLMLFDTWLLMRRHRGANKINRLIALCLLPLIILAGWWLLSTIGNTISTYLLSTAGVSSLPPSVTTPPTIQHHQITKKNNEDGFVVKERPAFSPPQSTTTTTTTNTNNDDNYHQLLSIIDDLKQEVDRVNRRLSDVEQLHSNDLYRVSVEYQAENLKNYARLSAKLKRCCYRSNFPNLQIHITKILTDLLNSPEFLTNHHAFNQYLHNLFMTKHELELKLSNLTHHLPHNIDDTTIEQTAVRVMDRIIAQIDTTTLTDQKIDELIRNSLEIYDADKTGLVDYAMETMGGEIVTTRCTEPYNGGTAVFSIFHIPLWSKPNTPRIVITPSINPGECWAFQNFPGFLVIKLSNRVRIDGFTLEHVSRLLIPNQRIDSAPKEFDVYGLNDENDPQPTLIGQYIYDYHGDSMQYFTVQQQTNLIYDMIELRIKSNHGNPNYTCLYRFRVHGSAVV